MEHGPVIVATAIIVVTAISVLGLFNPPTGTNDRMANANESLTPPIENPFPEDTEHLSDPAAQDDRDESHPSVADTDADRSFLFHPPDECSSYSDPVFRHGFINIQRVDALNPIGDPGGGSPGRSYISVTAGEPVPIYAPTTGIIDGITYADRGGGIGEYGVSFWATCHVHVLFDHLNGIPDWLQDYAPDTPANHTSTGTIDVHLPVDAGEVVGFKDGGEDVTTLDFLLLNANKTVEYINPDRFEWEQSLYADCPYDYFMEDLKAQYYGKLGVASNDGLMPADDCGSPSHDVAGTASGAWFIGENSTEFDGTYLQVARYVNQARIILKDETLSNRENARFSLRVYDPERYPEEILVGEQHCYERHRGEDGAWAYVRVLPDQRLSLAYGTAGGCPDSFPRSHAETWVR